MLRGRFFRRGPWEKEDEKNGQRERSDKQPKTENRQPRSLLGSLDSSDVSLLLGGALGEKRAVVAG
jgi:hypothetical protein